MLSLLALFSLSEASTCLDSSSSSNTFHLLSGTSTLVTGPDMSSYGPAKAVYTVSGWTASIPGATWIWDNNKVSSPTKDQTCNFYDSFFVTGAVHEAVLHYAADNHAYVYVNGVNIGCDKSNGSFTSSTQVKCTVTKYLKTGLNYFQFSVTNAGSNGSTYSTNPGGLLYKLSVTQRFQ